MMPNEMYIHMVSMVYLEAKCCAFHPDSDHSFTIFPCHAILCSGAIGKVTVP